MKRELKFRAYCDIGEENKMLLFTEGKYDNGLWFEHTSNHIDEYLSPLMQFTGLRDFKGTEIYEGDILEFPFEMGIAYVIHDGFRFAVKSPGSEAIDYEGQSVLEQTYIVGNIYENPEMIK